MAEQQQSSGMGSGLILLVILVIVVALMAGIGTAFKFSQIPTWFWWVAIGFVVLMLVRRKK